MVLITILGLIDVIAAALIYFAYSENILALIFVIVLAGKGLFSLISGLSSLS